MKQDRILNSLNKELKLLHGEEKLNLEGMDLIRVWIQFSIWGMILGGHGIQGRKLLEGGSELGDIAGPRSRGPPHTQLSPGLRSNWNSELEFQSRKRFALRAKGSRLLS